MRLSQSSTKMHRDHSVSCLEAGERRSVLPGGELSLPVEALYRLHYRHREWGMFRRAGLSGLHLDAVFNLSPNTYVLLNRELRMVGMTEAYPAATMSSEADLIGDRHSAG